MNKWLYFWKSFLKMYLMDSFLSSIVVKLCSCSAVPECSVRSVSLLRTTASNLLSQKTCSLLMSPKLVCYGMNLLSDLLLLVPETFIVCACFNECCV